jgi:hypothetical protein
MRLPSYRGDETSCTMQPQVLLCSATSGTWALAILCLCTQAIDHLTTLPRLLCLEMNANYYNVYSVISNQLVLC